MIFLLLFFFMLFQQVPDAVSGEPEEYLVRNFSVENGLPINSVNEIVQDDNGFLYFSSLDGLVRFDGYEFVTFNSSNTPGLANNRIAGIMMAGDGRLWLIGEAGGLTSYRHGTFHSYTREDGVPGTPFNIADNNGQFWISTQYGVAWFNSEQDRFVPLQDSLFTTATGTIKYSEVYGLLGVNKYGLVQYRNGKSGIVLPLEDFPYPGFIAFQILTSQNGDIWVLGGGGFFSLKDARTQPRLGFLFEDPAITFWSAASSANHTFIFSSTKGFYQLDLTSQVLTKLPFLVDNFTSRPNTILEGKSGELILIGDDEVIVNGQVVFEAEGLQAGFVDREGSIWVSSTTQGIYQLRKKVVQNLNLGSGFPVENIYPVIQASDGGIWAGSFGQGVIRFDKEGSSRQWNPENSSLQNNLVRTLFEDTNGTIYAGLWSDGLWKFENEDWVRLPGYDRITPGVNETVEAIFRDRKDRFFVGTQDEMLEQTGNGDFREFRDSQGNTVSAVRGIRQAGNGTLFFATNGNGLVVMDNGNKTKYLTRRQGIASDFIRDIFIHSDDTLWLATENNGLNRLVFDENYNVQSIKHISTSDGLTSNSLHRIIEDPFGYFWVNSNHGIMRISATLLNAYADGAAPVLSLIGFDQRDGMLNPEGNGGVQSAGILSSGNKLWFPNLKGITVIDPANPGMNEALPAALPVIEQISFSGTHQLASGKKHIEIPKGERNLAIKFRAPNFAYPERVRIKYMLEGVNPGWEISNEGREAAFTNLDPGTYTFRVASERVDGALAETSVSLVIPSFFVETSWFYALSVLGIAALVFGGFRYRVRALQHRQQKLQTLVDEQTKELRQAEEDKSRFFSGITHELKTPLSMIIGPAEELINNPDATDEEQQHQYLHAIQRNGYRLKNLVDQILDVTKLNANAINLTLQPVDMVELTAQVIGQFHSMLQQNEIGLKTEFPAVGPTISADRDAWERIVINLLSNAIKFSPKGSRVIVSISEKDEQVVLAIKDFGKGIARRDQQKVFDYLYQVGTEHSAEGTGIGLFLVKGLVERMGGNVGVSSELGKGAEFTVSISKAGENIHDEEKAVSVNDELEPDEQKIPAEDDQTTAAENRERILVVEDNEDFRNFLQSILSKKYQVNTTSDGAEALKVMLDFKPNLVISDVMMPGMNGLDLVRTMRRQEDFKYLPVIFLSAKDQDLDIETGLLTGADIYLTKPIRSTTLLLQIAAVLRRERILNSSLHAGGAEAEMPPLMQKVKNIVYRQLANQNLNIEMLADTLFVSRSKLFKDWKKLNDVTINEFIRQLRLEEGKVLIQEQKFSVQEAARAVGFTDPNYFSTSFKKEFGVSPSEVK